MVTTRGGTELNGVDAESLRAYIDSVKADPARADREPTVVARWVGGTRAEVVSTLGGPPVYIGGDDDPSAMEASPVGDTFARRVPVSFEIEVT